MKITVGTAKNKRQMWRYQDVPVDRKGWVIDLHFHPAPFDICFIKIKDKPKPINGWWTGIEWFSLRLRGGDQVISWKINKEFS